MNIRKLPSEIQNLIDKYKSDILVSKIENQVLEQKIIENKQNIIGFLISLSQKKHLKIRCIKTELSKMKASSDLNKIMSYQIEQKNLECEINLLYQIQEHIIILNEKTL